MGRKNNRGKGVGHRKGEFATTLSSRTRADGSLKKLAYVPLPDNLRKPRKRRNKRKRRPD